MEAALRRSIEPTEGKDWTTLQRLLISRFALSWTLLVLSFAQWAPGNAWKARAESSAAEKISAALGEAFPTQGAASSHIALESPGSLSC